MSFDNLSKITSPGPEAVLLFLGYEVPFPSLSGRILTETDIGGQEMCHYHSHHSVTSLL